MGARGSRLLEALGGEGLEALGGEGLRALGGDGIEALGVARGRLLHASALNTAKY